MELEQLIEFLRAEVVIRAQCGGGHTRAAGFSTSMELEQLVEFLRAEVGAQRNSLPGGQPAAPVA